MICRLIAPQWLMESDPDIQSVVEGDFTDDQLNDYNCMGYNIYNWPNSPSVCPAVPVNGTHIDKFEWIFVDMDLKDGVYESKEAFYEKVKATQGPLFTKLVDSGNGIHIYWKVSDLDAKSYLRFQRRLMRLLNTDPAVSKIAQLMRVPGYVNTKDPNDYKICHIVDETTTSYTCEEIDKALPPITVEDEQYCEAHYNKTYGINQESPYKLLQEMPAKWGKLLRKNAEASQLFSHTSGDRSDDDFRLALLMQASGFTADEAYTVLYNSGKAMQRAPVHRHSYAQNIVEKIWVAEEEKQVTNLSPTVRDILSRGDEVIKGKRFPCHKLIDDTKHGFRLGQVIGIIGGSGVGKTTLTLNMFLWFSANNPDFHHFFFSLEQPVGEIASRIRTICGDDTALYDRIHIISNYSDDGTYNNYSLATIEEHILEYKKATNCKVGTVVIDHIGVLSKETRNGENDGLIGVCKDMKSIAVRLNVMLIMLSQAPREKSGIGDLELNKDAAYGTVFFESFVDYCLCLWQPLKRVYTKGAPTIMSFKFAKIRHKSQKYDNIKEDVCNSLFFDPETERLRELTQQEETSADFFLKTATNLRKADRKTDLVTYVSRRVDEPVNNDTDSK